MIFVPCPNSSRTLHEKWYILQIDIAMLFSVSVTCGGSVFRCKNTKHNNLTRNIPEMVHKAIMRLTRTLFMAQKDSSKFSYLRTQAAQPYWLITSSSQVILKHFTKLKNILNPFHPVMFPRVSMIFLVLVWSNIDYSSDYVLLK